MKTPAEHLLDILDTKVPTFKESQEFAFLYPTDKEIIGLVCSALGKYCSRLLNQEHVGKVSHELSINSTFEILTSIFDTIELLTELPTVVSKELLKDELFESVDMFGDKILEEKFQRNLKPKSRALFEEWRVKNL